MRISTGYISLTAIGVIILMALLVLHPFRVRNVNEMRLEREREMVKRLALTDIALFTEASYTRHPNLADRFVPFQNHPMAISQFPSESLLPPPVHLVSANAGVHIEERP